MITLYSFITSFDSVLISSDGRVTYVLIYGNL